MMSDVAVFDIKGRAGTGGAGRMKRKIYVKAFAFYKLHIK